MKAAGLIVAVLCASVLLVGADKRPAPVLNYENLEGRLRAATAQSKPTDPTKFSFGNYAAEDNPQEVELKLIPLAVGSSLSYARVRSSLGAERIFFSVPGNRNRAYFAGAAVATPGGPWSPFDSADAPPIHPQSVRPDMAIGPPPELMGKQRAYWDVIAFNVRSGDQAGVFEYFNVDEACRLGGYSIKVVQSPSHGDVTVSEAQFFAPDLIAEAFAAQHYDQPDSRAKCHPTDFRSGVVLYTPTPGYVGRDSATVLINDHGYESIEHFVLRVLPKPG
jgi:hypothetical protein